MASVMGREVLLVCVVMIGAFFGVAFSAQSCSTLLASSNGFTACQDLTELASTLAWRINNGSSTVDFAFSGGFLESSYWLSSHKSILTNYTPSHMQSSKSDLWTWQLELRLAYQSSFYLPTRIDHFHLALVQ